jgi:AcrR family transcriptional regulator
MHNRGEHLGRRPERVPKKAFKMNDLKEMPTKGKGSRRAAVRIGRPPKEFEGEVDARILDAALKIFLRRGFEGASIDEIAVAARAGKPTIYARFGDKRGLFTAVVTRDVLSRIAQFHTEAPTEGTIEQRLAHVATALLNWTLDNERMALMRLAIAEAQRFPDLASTVSRAARQLSTEVAARLLAEMAQSGELGTLPAFAPEHLAATARFFLDLVVVPMLLRGLFEAKVETLQAEIGPHVARSAAFFLAACRQGGSTSASVVATTLSTRNVP